METAALTFVLLFATVVALPYEWQHRARYNAAPLGVWSNMRLAHTQKAAETSTSACVQLKDARGGVDYVVRICEAEQGGELKEFFVSIIYLCARTHNGLGGYQAHTGASTNRRGCARMPF